MTVCRRFLNLCFVSFTLKDKFRSVERRSSTSALGMGENLGGEGGGAKGKNEKKVQLVWLFPHQQTEFSHTRRYQGAPHSRRERRERGKYHLSSCAPSLLPGPSPYLMLSAPAFIVPSAKKGIEVDSQVCDYVTSSSSSSYRPIHSSVCHSVLGTIHPSVPAADGR